MGFPSDPNSNKNIVMGYPSPTHQYNPHQPPPFHPQPQPYSASPYNHQTPIFQPQDAGKYPYPAPTPQPYNYYYQNRYGKEDPALTALPTMPHDTAQKTSFGRVMLILVLVLVVSICMMVLVMWFLFGTYIPEFRVETIKVSNFSVSNAGVLKGQWHVEMSVANTNRELTINFNKVVSDIIYKDAELGVSKVKPFSVHKMSRSHLDFSMASEKTPPPPTTANLAQERSNGTVVFSVMLMMEANFTGSTMMHRQDYIKVWCENLQIKFESNGDGNLLPGKGHRCLIRLHQTVKT